MIFSTFENFTGLKKYNDPLPSSCEEKNFASIRQIFTLDNFTLMNFLFHRFYEIFSIKLYQVPGAEYYRARREEEGIL